MQVSMVRLLATASVLVTVVGGLGAIALASPGVGDIETFAGDGTAAFAGDGGPAISASLEFPSGVAVDGDGNVFISSGSDRVRKVAVGSGTITTVAGNGVLGFAGDGGLATAAQLSRPRGITFDAAGNLYIADYFNRRVRRVDQATQIMTTVAGDGTSGFSGDGGLATAAQLDGPSGVAVDAAGNLYIADRANHRIRRVDASTSVITTIAGSGATGVGNGGFSGDGGAATSARMDLPADVAVDASGNLFVVEEGNSVVRRIDGSTGVITTVAGTGVAGFSGDGGAATSAQLGARPRGLALDGDGNLLISDGFNDRIRMVDAASGIITTVAGTGTAGFSGDGGPATSATIDQPDHVAVDLSGNVLVVDQANHRVRLIEMISTPFTPVPVPSITSWGLAAMAVVLGTLLLRAIRRQDAIRQPE